MGKKRKVVEFDEDERIQTIVVCEPYGWNDEKTWDADDKRRRDNGMYVFVEWLEFIYGGGQRGRGDVVEDVYSWSSRNELLVSIRKDINLDSQLGKHWFEEFLRNPIWRGVGRHTSIFKAYYRVEEEILNRGDGWKLCTNVPKIAPSSIRRYRFTTPYPIPHAAVPPISGRGYMQSLPQKLLQDREELRKPKPPIEVKPDIKNVKDEDQKGDVKSEDVKPAIQNEEAKVFKAEQVEQKPVKVEQGLVKPEPHDGSMKAEPEEDLATLMRHQYAYENELASSSALNQGDIQGAQGNSQDALKPEEDRPNKKIKLEK